ncbi:MAG: RMD1 family protein [Bacteroidota bacterium]
MKQSEPEKIIVKAYDVASSYDLKAAREILVNNFAGKVLNMNPLLVQIGNHKMIGMFDYGSIVFFNHFQAEITETLDTLRGCAFRPNRRFSEDEYVLSITSRLQMPEGTEELFIKEFNKDIAMVVSVVLSRSVSLEYYESLISDTFGQLEDSVSTLAREGRIQKNERTLTKEVGLAISVEQELAYNLSAFDEPEIVWSGGKRIDELYKKLKREFDLDDRIRAIQQKVSIISRSSTFVISRLEAQRAQILEWIIIILIISEIILALLGKM